MSAPVFMLASQALATARLAVAPSEPAACTLGVLGALMASGYLIEHEFRAALLSPGEWDPVVTPVAAVGFTLALAMAGLGLCRWGCAWSGDGEASG